MLDSIDRRDFLKASCAVAAGTAALHGAAVEAADTGGLRLRKAVKLSMVAGT